MRTGYNKIQVIIADDHSLFREGVKTMLSKQDHIIIIAEASDGEELCRQVEKHLPDVVITDISMPKVDGISATKCIKKKFPQIEVIALSTHDCQDIIESILEAGASAYLLKNSSIEEIAEAVKVVHQGNMHYSFTTSTFINSIIKHHRSPQKNNTSFTSKEIYIMQLICKEKPTKEIASILGLHERTIEDYRKRIQKKTNSKNMIGIAIYAIRHKIFKL